MKTYYHLLKPKASDSDFNPKSEHIFVITAHDWNERHSIFVYELTLGGGSRLWIEMLLAKTSEYLSGRVLAQGLRGLQFKPLS